MMDWPTPRPHWCYFSPHYFPLPALYNRQAPPVDIDLGYTINVPCFYHSLFLTAFVSGDIKYFRIGVGLLQEGKHIKYFFYTILIS